MSQTGIKVAAEVFSFMQTKSLELMKLGCDEPINKQDIRLAQMLETGKDAMKDIFTKETLTTCRCGRPK